MSEWPVKQPEQDDPMELRGVQCDGDPDYMIDCLVEEYARIGWPAEKILQLFESPFYPVLHSMLAGMGREAIRRRIERVAARCGVFRTRTFEAAPPAELVAIAPLGAGDTQDE
jgi:hypothetical protein